MTKQRKYWPYPKEWCPTCKRMQTVAECCLHTDPGERYYCPQNHNYTRKDELKIYREFMLPLLHTARLERKAVITKTGERRVEVVLKKMADKKGLRGQVCDRAVAEPKPVAKDSGKN